MAEYIPATPANMRQYGGEGVVALDPETGDKYSATPGDYFWLADDEPLTNGDGEPLILAIAFESVRPLERS